MVLTFKTPTENDIDCNPMAMIHDGCDDQCRGEPTQCGWEPQESVAGLTGPGVMS